MEIVKAGLEHLEEICAIEESSFTDPWSRGTLSQCIQGKFAAVLVALEDGDVLGHAIFNVMADEAELYNIAVRRESRGRGVGTALLQGTMRLARQAGAERMFLEVRKSNAAAREMYRKAGFAVCGQRRNYYEAPREDAMIMDIQLGERA